MPPTQEKRFWKEGERFLTPTCYFRPDPKKQIQHIKKEGLTFQIYDLLPGDLHLDDLGIDDHNVYGGTLRLPTVRVFGLTPEGNSVYVQLYNVWPYFYLEVPEDFQQSDVETLHEYAEAYLRKHLKPYQLNGRASGKLFMQIFGTTEREYLADQRNIRSYDKKDSDGKTITVTPTRVYRPNGGTVKQKLKIDALRADFHAKEAAHQKGHVGKVQMAALSPERRKQALHKNQQLSHADDAARKLFFEKNALLTQWYAETKRYLGELDVDPKKRKTWQTRLPGPVIRSVRFDEPSTPDAPNTRSLEHANPCTQHFVRIELSSPRYVTTLRDHFESDAFRWQTIVRDPQDERFTAHRFHTFESDFAFVSRVWVNKAARDKIDVDGAPWVHVAPEHLDAIAPKKNPTRQQLAYNLLPEHLKPLQDDAYNTKLAPFRILSYDIECCSQVPKEFPRAERDPVIQIAVVLQEHGSRVRKRALFHLDTCAPIVSADHLFGFEDEADMLKAFAQFCCDCSAEVVTGYNIVDFDYPYLADRARTLKLPGFLDQTKVIGEAMRIEDSTYEGGSGFSSKMRAKQKEKAKLEGGMGQGLSRWYKPTKTKEKEKKEKEEEEEKEEKARLAKKITMQGMVVMDMFFMIKTFPFPRKHKSYTLNAMSAHYLGSQKLDMDYELIPVFQSGTARDRRRLGEYCLWDAELPLNLMDQLKIFMLLVNFSRTTGLPMDAFLKRGVTARILISIYRLGMELDYRVPYHDTSKVTVGDKFQGATVLEPKKGFYTKPVATLDFAALYPSIMLAHNLCYSTYVLASQIKKRGLVKGKDYHTTPAGFHFLDASVRKGLCSFLLERLLGRRKQAKKAMAAAKERGDKQAAAIYNGLQLAIKVLCNSVYGFTGAAAGKLPCFAISTSVTAYGRQMIEQTSDIITEHFRPTDGSVCPTCEMEHRHQANVIYGDSVTADTPVLLRLKDGSIVYRPISQLPHATWIECDNGDKAYATPSEPLEVWSDTGFTTIERVMRHRTNKSIYRVLAHTGVVNVTEDHSLLRANGEEVAPRDLSLGEALMVQPLPSLGTDGINIPLAYVWGLFYGDGSCGTYDCPSGKKSSWAINNQSLELLNTAKALLDKHTPFVFNILQTMQSSGVYKLVPTGQGVSVFVQTWRQRFYDPHKKIPDVLWKSDLTTRQAFFDGYYAADGDKDKHGYCRFDNKGTYVVMCCHVLSCALAPYETIN